MKKTVDLLCNAIFWIWNLSFLLLVYIGVLPNVAPFLIQATFAGTLPLTFLVSLTGLVLAPTVCTLVGWFYLRKQPVLLMRLFYGVEAPIFALCLLRLFIIREMTPASAQILGTLTLCIFTFSVELLCGYLARWRVLSWLQMMGHSLMLITGTYVGTLLIFYTVPAFCVSLYNVLQFQWLTNFWQILITQPLEAVWWNTVFFLIFAFTCSLFFAMPFAVVKLYVQSWWRMFLAFGARHGQLKAGATTAGVAIAWFLVFTALQQQPQIEAFKLLDQPAQTDSDRQELLKQSDTIRVGLLNAYLSSYRYLSPWEESNQLREMYRYVFNLSESDAQAWQDFHNHWISPFLYNGSRADADKAAELYAQFFDVPIQKAERQAIQHALQSTVNRDEVQAGLININQRIVHLGQQQVTVQEHGDWADVELYELYENPTSRDQEIFYSFSLPESTVITGVWLGDTIDRDKRFPFTVSPRGAAQQVYNGEVDRANVTFADDPALLEQVGPRQYRLRVFPIPAREAVGKPGQLHLWLTYKTMRQDNGWALPHLTEKRNIFWTKDTERLRNGKRARVAEDEWLEAALPAHQHPPAVHQVELGGDRITARPLKAQDYKLPQGKRFALVLDRSHSMATHTRELSETFRWLNQNRANNDVDVYLTSSAGAEPQRIDDIRQVDPAKITFYGSLQIQQMLWQFAQLKGNTAYDAVLVLTDEGSYELSKDVAESPAITVPLWAIHLGGQLPPAYDDATLQLIQASRGGVSTNLLEVMQRLGTEALAGSSVASVTNGYIWTVVPSASAGTSAASGAVSESEFAPIAARQLILKLSREQDMTQLAALDQVHALAKQTEVVTPYSSMLVLVNDRQRELLRQAEASGDRFNREVENGQDELGQPNNPLNAVAVPEPGDVLGLGVVAIVLLFIAKGKPRPVRSHIRKL